jgi:hypothetical protein
LPLPVVYVDLEENRTVYACTAGAETAADAAGKLAVTSSVKSGGDLH